MSRVCVSCGKRPSVGQNRSHSNRATKRRFEPNLQRVRILVEGRPRNAYVCARCLKSGRVLKAV
jgi:large subunit ribosomal protein L28